MLARGLSEWMADTLTESRTRIAPATVTGRPMMSNGSRIIARPLINSSRRTSQWCSGETDRRQNRPTRTCGRLSQANNIST